VLFEADVDSGEWVDYIKYVDTLVVNGFFEAIYCSLNYFIENTEPGVQPLFIAQLELQAPQIVFKPSLNDADEGSFLRLIQSLLDDIYKISSLVTRVAPQTGQEDYQEDMMTLDVLTGLNHDIIHRVKDASDKAVNYTQNFLIFNHLWQENRNDYMRQFLKYGKILTAAEMEIAVSEGRPDTPPSLEQFKEQSFS
jgi:dynein heavy chain